MEIHSLLGNFSTITDVIYFLWNRHGRRILIFFSRNVPFLLLLCIKQARTNGSHVGLKPVWFVTQPKLRIMCLHFLRQFHRLHFV